METIIHKRRCCAFVFNPCSCCCEDDECLCTCDFCPCVYVYIKLGNAKVDILQEPTDLKVVVMK